MFFLRGLVPPEELLRRAATFISIACALLLIGTAVIAAVPALRARLGLGMVSGPAYTVGDPVDVPSTIYESAPHTLLIFVRSSCPACQSYRPAFAALVGMARKSNIQVTILVRNGDESERQYALDLGLEEDRVKTVDFSKLRLRRVPTTLLVDSRGLIYFSQEGPPPSHEDEHFLRTLISLSASL
jgi:hypothetical protein